MHDTSLITTLAFGFAAALFFALIAKRIGLSPIVGYLLAGLAASPHTPGFVGDVGLAAQLAEIGVILLMFGVGLHFHLKDLLAVRMIAIPGALGQSAVATVCMMGFAYFAGWSWSQGLVLGIATAVASTVVLLRVLMDHRKLESPAGHVAVGWLIVEDLITVLVLVLLPAFGATEAHSGGASLLVSAAWAIGKIVLLVAIAAVAGTRFVPWLLLRVARLRSRELFTLAVLVLSIAMATGAYVVFDVSMALGAFMAGMLVGQSKFSAQAGADALPLRDAFAVLFFFSVGMLFDWRAIAAEPLLLLGVLFVVLVAKPVAAIVIVLACRHSLRTALTVAGGLAQIGEFSFILAEVAKSLGLLPGQGHALLVAAAIVSIALNPFLFRGLLALEPWILRQRWAAWITQRSEAHGTALNASHEPGWLDGAQAVVVGYGPVGETVTRLLREFEIRPLIVEMNIDTVTELNAAGQRALYGDATRPEILVEAGLARARYLVLTLPDAAIRHAIITAARELNPDIQIFTRARYLAEQPALLAAGATVMCFDEAEAAAGLAEALLTRMAVPAERIAQEVLEIRAALGSVVTNDDSPASS